MTMQSTLFVFITPAALKSLLMTLVVLCSVPPKFKIIHLRHLVRANNLMWMPKKENINWMTNTETLKHCWSIYTSHPYWSVYPLCLTDFLTFSGKSSSSVLHFQQIVCVNHYVKENQIVKLIYIFFKTLKTILLTIYSTGTVVVDLLYDLCELQLFDSMTAPFPAVQCSAVLASRACALQFSHSSASSVSSRLDTVASSVSVCLLEIFFKTLQMSTAEIVLIYTHVHPRGILQKKSAAIQDCKPLTWTLGLPWSRLSIVSKPWQNMQII